MVSSGLSISAFSSLLSSNVAFRSSARSRRPFTSFLRVSLPLSGAINTPMAAPTAAPSSTAPISLPVSLELLMVFELNKINCLTGYPVLRLNVGFIFVSAPVFLHKKTTKKFLSSKGSFGSLESGFGMACLLNRVLALDEAKQDSDHGDDQ